MEGKIWTVDRLEGDLAVCEDEHRGKRELPLSDLPQPLREGDCLRQTAGGYVLDPQETLRRRGQNKALQDRLFGR